LLIEAEAVSEIRRAGDVVDHTAGLATPEKNGRGPLEHLDSVQVGNIGRPGRVQAESNRFSVAEAVLEDVLLLKATNRERFALSDE